jgi:hypothetical protein
MTCLSETEVPRPVLKEREETRKAYAGMIAEGPIKHKRKENIHIHIHMGCTPSRYFDRIKE